MVDPIDSISLVILQLLSIAINPRWETTLNEEPLTLQTSSLKSSYGANLLYFKVSFHSSFFWSFIRSEFWDPFPIHTHAIATVTFETPSLFLFD